MAIHMRRYLIFFIAHKGRFLNFAHTVQEVWRFGGVYQWTDAFLTGFCVFGGTE